MFFVSISCMIVNSPATVACHYYTIVRKEADWSREFLFYSMKNNDL